MFFFQFNKWHHKNDLSAKLILLEIVGIMELKFFNIGQNSSFKMEHWIGEQFPYQVLVTGQNAVLLNHTMQHKP